MIPIAYNCAASPSARRPPSPPPSASRSSSSSSPSALMLADGIKKTLGRSGRADVAIVLRKGSDAELASGIEPPQVNLILAAPGVTARRKGQPVGVGEVVVVVAAGQDRRRRRRPTCSPRRARRRAGASAPTVRIVEGRPREARHRRGDRRQAHPRPIQGRSSSARPSSSARTAR